LQQISAPKILTDIDLEVHKYRAI